MEITWPERRQDVLNALDVLAAEVHRAESDRNQTTPTLTDAVHWLIDDTFWDVRDPAEDIGALLLDEHEANAIRSVVASVEVIARRQGTTASDALWFDDPEWPLVTSRAARAASELRGFAR
ncbi:hypothetical protein [Nocardiopsis sp. Huas11]|uniref:SCO4402 family protein n=1 Tax=Nocardiopsis sp. Huas11 TaxID=2183912 RepID=UPI0018F67225|nr:hypothetical protein [Nocardiopsis sp. Huas11]